MASPPSSPPNNPSPSKPKPPSSCPNPKPPFSHPTKHRSPSPRSKPRNLRTSPHAASSSPISSNHPIPSNPKPQPSTTPRHPSSTSTPLSSPNSHTPPPPATLANLQPAHRPLPNSNSPYRVAARGRVLINLPTGAEAWPPLPAPQSKLDLISGSNPQSGSSTAKWLEKTMKKDGKKIIAEVRSSLGKSKTTGKAKRKMDESASEASLDPPLTKQEEREL